MHSPGKSVSLIGPIGAVALALAAPGLVQAYPIMPDGEPIHIAGEAGQLPTVQRSHSTMTPGGIAGVSVAEKTKTPSRPARIPTNQSSSAWSGMGQFAAVSILAALAVLAAAHLTRQLRRSATSRRIGG